MTSTPPTGLVIYPPADEVVAVPSLAGSAGKTTLTVTLAGVLAEAGARVRVIDADRQANATHHLGFEPGSTVGLVELLRSRGRPGEPTLRDVEQPTRFKNITLVPGRQELESVTLELERREHGLGAEQRLRRALADPTTEAVDVTLIDCPGNKNILSLAALVAARTVVTVTFLGYKEMAGIEDVESFVEDVRDAYNPSLSLAGVVPSAVPPPNAGKFYTAALAMLQSSYEELLTPPVRRSPRVLEAYSQQTPLNLHVANLRTKDPIVNDYRAVARWLAQRGALPLTVEAEPSPQATTVG